MYVYFKMCNTKLYFLVLCEQIEIQLEGARKYFMCWSVVMFKKKLYLREECARNMYEFVFFIICINYWLQLTNYN